MKSIQILRSHDIDQEKNNHCKPYSVATNAIRLVYPESLKQTYNSLITFHQYPGTQSFSAIR